MPTVSRQNTPFQPFKTFGSSAATLLDWQQAVHEFLLHLDAIRAPKTKRFYDIQLRQLVRWAEEQAVPFDAFGKRHIDWGQISNSCTLPGSQWRAVSVTPVFDAACPIPPASVSHQS